MTAYGLPRYKKKFETIHFERFMKVASFDGFFVLFVMTELTETHIETGQGSISTGIASSTTIVQPSWRTIGSALIRILFQETHCCNFRYRIQTQSIFCIVHIQSRFHLSIFLNLCQFIKSDRCRSNCLVSFKSEAC